MAVSWAWLKTAKGIFKVFALILDVLALAFFVESVGFLKPPEYRLFFIASGGYLLIILYRIIGFMFESNRQTGHQDALADIIGALLLVSLSVLIVIRAVINEEPMAADFALLMTSAAFGCLAGLILALDACIGLV